MDLVHITSYAEKPVFEKMEKIRKKRIGRITRSQWVNEAIAEKVEREWNALPDSDSPKKRSS